MISEFFFYF